MPHGDQRDHAQSQLFSLAVWRHSKAACSADVVLVGIILEKMDSSLESSFSFQEPLFRSTGKVVLQLCPRETI